MAKVNGGEKGIKWKWKRIFEAVMVRWTEVEQWGQDLDEWQRWMEKEGK